MRLGEWKRIGTEAIPPPLPRKGQSGGEGRFYFFDLQPQPQPEDLASSFTMLPVSLHEGHFLGLQRPSFVAPHFSHLNTAMISPFLLWVLTAIYSKTIQFLLHITPMDSLFFV